MKTYQISTDAGQVGTLPKKTRKRYKWSRVDWSTVNWDQGSTQIAILYGVTAGTVTKHRREHAPQSIGKIKKWINKEAFVAKMTAQKNALGEKHESARGFVLRDPSGRIFRGVNVRKFVRDNPSMFLARDLNWDARVPRAADGLCRVLIGKVSAWKGWTAVWGDENR